MRKINGLACLFSFLIGIFLFGMVHRLWLSDLSVHPYLKEYPPPKTPTLFEFYRSGTEMLHFRDRDAIIQRAKQHLFGGEPPDFIENYVMIEDGDAWYVYFGQRGNGLFDESREKNICWILFEGTNSIYLAKDTLEMIPPNKGQIRTGVYPWRLDEE